MPSLAVDAASSNSAKPHKKQLGHLTLRKLASCPEGKGGGGVVMVSYRHCGMFSLRADRGSAKEKEAVDVAMENQAGCGGCEMGEKYASSLLFFIFYFSSFFFGLVLSLSGSRDDGFVEVRAEEACCLGVCVVAVFVFGAEVVGYA